MTDGVRKGGSQREGEVEIFPVTVGFSKYISLC